MESRAAENEIRRVSPFLLVGLALASMVVSAALAIAGKRKVASFIGQWVPSLLILATFNRPLQGGGQASLRRASTALANGMVGAPTGHGTTSAVGSMAG